MRHCELFLLQDACGARMKAPYLLIVQVLRVVPEHAVVLGQLAHHNSALRHTQEISQTLKYRATK
jgi:hypothetical protein